jgi:DNA-binding response OmpR family regulator
MHAYVVAQDPDDRDHLAFILRRAGLSISLKAELASIMHEWVEHPADLILVSGIEGAEILNGIKPLRGITEAPIIALLPHSTDQMNSDVLAAGADVVLPATVGWKTLSAYALAVLRRSGGMPSFTIPTIDLDEICLDPASRTVHLNGTEHVRLTQLEFRLLYTLMSNRGQVLPYETIIERVWGYEGTGSRELIRGLISRLRGKIEADPKQPRYIHTISSVGYLFSLGEK